MSLFKAKKGLNYFILCVMNRYNVNYGSQVTFSVQWWNSCELIVFFFFSGPAVGAMLSRGLRAGAYDLPGAESAAVPLIGYRPLSRDHGSLADQVERDSSDSKTAQVRHRVIARRVM